jgi:hypothetical protein
MTMMKSRTVRQSNRRVKKMNKSDLERTWCGELCSTYLGMSLRISSAAVT